MTVENADVLVVGSGIAGCAAALGAARAGAEVLVVTKASEPEDAASDWAQGGIAVTRDDPESFRDDVLTASDGEADPEAVDVLVSNARNVVDDVLLDTLDVAFDTDGDGYDFGREAAHSSRRILHVDASTGRHVLRPFLRHLQAHDRVTVRDDTAVLDLLTHEGRVYGAHLESSDTERSAEPVFAGATVLATGGVGACYGRSTNPDGATGDGVAMAALAGAAIEDVQYVQFHPTAYVGEDDRDGGSRDDGDEDGPFLVSEAVRGEGGVLRNATGERFMLDVHPDAELAPRDVVARAVACERARTGEVRLDVSALDFADEFPDLAALCEARGVDPADGIPVAPSEHFLCGGVAVDDRGRTTLDRLFAVGECARTGVHGANRLASTSLLEGLVWGLRAGEAAAGNEVETVEAPRPRDGDPSLPPSFAETKLRRLQTLMDEHVGLERTPDGLRRATAALRRLKGEVDAYTRTRTSRELYELRNACVTGLLVARAAAEHPSAGCHRVVADDEGEGPPSGGRDDAEEARVRR
ncbi:L-aspartate oxidase [Halogranum amylolyticum]|uniref:L-aspartate oxidase n=1 Tax=Halogranum amylolyticum TaxID=660520 RepID=A0A1H8NBF3_9EURY|nr:FAD-dependent oxidoreductase [Halogranum amylolyticum]SEO26848.1 L-aspartate oxidase [Halogranum amylolyticum]